MKKTILKFFGVALLGIAMASCGDKYTPLTDEQKTAKADSIFNATSADLKAKKEEACAAEMQGKVAEKVQQLISEAQPVAAK